MAWYKARILRGTMVCSRAAYGADISCKCDPQTDCGKWNSAYPQCHAMPAQNNITVIIQTRQPSFQNAWNAYLPGMHTIAELSVLATCCLAGVWVLECSGHIHQMHPHSQSITDRHCATLGMVWRLPFYPASPWGFALHPNLPITYKHPSSAPAHKPQHHPQPQHPCRHQPTVAPAALAISCSSASCLLLPA